MLILGLIGLGLVMMFNGAFYAGSVIFAVGVLAAVCKKVFG